MNKNVLIGILVLIIIVLGYVSFKGGALSQDAAVIKSADNTNYNTQIEYIKNTLEKSGEEAPDNFYPIENYADAARFAKIAGIPAYNSVEESVAVKMNQQGGGTTSDRHVACDWIMGGQIIASSGNAPYNTGVTDLGNGVWRHCYWASSIN